MLSNKLTDEQKIEWFDRAMKFAVERKYVFEMVAFKGGESVWAIYDWNTYFTEERKVLNADGELEPDLPFEKHDKAFTDRTRFSFDQAFELVEMLAMLE
jgi:hypothetical protein